MLQSCVKCSHAGMAQISNGGEQEREANLHDALIANFRTQMTGFYNLWKANKYSDSVQSVHRKQIWSKTIIQGRESKQMENVPRCRETQCLTFSSRRRSVSQASASMPVFIYTEVLDLKCVFTLIQNHIHTYSIREVSQQQIHFFHFFLAAVTENFI